MKQIIRKATVRSIKGARKLLIKGRYSRAFGIKLKSVLFPVPLTPAHAGFYDFHDFYPTITDYYYQQQEQANFKRRPLISVIIPTYNTSIELLKSCIESVITQSYTNWEICLADDASSDKNVVKTIKHYMEHDNRIKLVERKQNGHISAASNSALGIAKGEYIGLLDHDDVLWPNALYEVVKRINEKEKIDFIYTDEDKVSETGDIHAYPFFKPDWNPDFLHTVNYITHFAVIRAELVHEVGGFRTECVGAQDWDLFLRISNKTKAIEHIPKLLYSWRISETSTASSMEAKPYAQDAQRIALQDDLKTKGYPDAKVETGLHSVYWHIAYPIKNRPLVSIVIPTKNQYEIVKRCIRSIYAKTTYSNFEVVLVDTGSTDEQVHKWYKILPKRHRNLRIINWLEEPFSYARACNYGASQAAGKYLVMLNNDTEVITKNWLEQLLGDAQRPDIGAVGCKLYYPDGIHIQHAGIGIGLGGLAANCLSRVNDEQMTQLQHLYANTKHNVTAVTAACLMIEKKKFDEVGGFDEKFRITFNDVDFCLRLVEAGYYNLYNPRVSLLHHESISVGRPEEKTKRDPEERKAADTLFKRRWRKYINYDPNLNPNIDRDSALFEIKVPKA